MQHQDIDISYKIQVPRNKQATMKRKSVKKLLVFRIRNPFVICFLFLGLLFFSSRVVNAQQLSLSINPPLLELTIKPGKTVLIAYTVGNYGDPTALRARVLPFRAKDNQGNIVIEEEFSGPIRFSLDNADIQMDEPFFAKTRSTNQLLLRIRVPEGAPDGDYYYTFLTESQPPPGVEGTTSSQARGSIGSNILITVTNSGRVDIKGQVSTFDTLKGFLFNFFGNKLKIFDSADKIPVVLEVENLGKNVIKPSGEITLKGNLGEQAKYSILEQNILAESKRILTATPSADIPDSIHQPVTLVLSGFFIGTYKLSTNISFGEGAPNIFAQTSFIALPLKFIFGFIIVLFLVLYVIKKLKK